MQMTIFNKQNRVDHLISSSATRHWDVKREADFSLFYNELSIFFLAGMN